MTTLSDDEIRALASAQRDYGPKPSWSYRHHKGGVYVISSRSLRESDLEPLVTYWRQEDGVYWTRTVAEFMEPVEVEGKTRPRFGRVD